MSNQYEVLGKAPVAGFKKLSPNNHHLVKDMNVVMGKWKFYIILIFL